MGNSRATTEDVIEASKAACCHEFIERLPRGYETRIGRGRHLPVRGGGPAGGHRAGYPQGTRRSSCSTRPPPSRTRRTR